MLSPLAFSSLLSALTLSPLGERVSRPGVFFSRGGAGAGVERLVPVLGGVGKKSI
jgi:hypothetical protein